MAKKEFNYRGFNLEQLKAMSVEEFANIAGARARRSLKRAFPAKHKKLLQRVRKNQGKAVRTHCRDMIILPEFVGRKFSIYNGKEYLQVDIAPEMIGLYLGEFANTRRRIQHSAPGMGATRASKFVSLK